MQEEQNDERDALRSIYDGDENFSVLSDTVFQYRIGASESAKSLLLQVEWSAEYPARSAAQLSLDLFFNRHLLPAVKERVLRQLNEQANELIGMAATFSLIEFLRENQEELLAEQPETFAELAAATGNDAAVESEHEDEDEENGGCASALAGKAKKKAAGGAALTKGQKRRLWDKGQGTETRERGWNWVDVVRHLSQTGTQLTTTTD